VGARDGAGDTGIYEGSGMGVGRGVGNFVRCVSEDWFQQNEQTKKWTTKMEKKERITYKELGQQTSDLVDRD